MAVKEMCCEKWNFNSALPLMITDWTAPTMQNLISLHCGRKRTMIKDSDVKGTQPFSQILA